MTTKERLVQALIESNAPRIMIELARNGEYDDYESNRVTPQLDLIQDCKAYGLHKLKERVMNDEFAGSREEAEAWWEREGKDLFRQ